MSLCADATAAIGIVRRTGLGKVRHLAVADLWVQDKVRQGRLSVSKLHGADNGADLMTKPLDRHRIEKLLDILGIVMRDPEGANGEEKAVLVKESSVPRAAAGAKRGVEQYWDGFEPLVGSWANALDEPEPDANDDVSRG